MEKRLRIIKIMVLCVAILKIGISIGYAFSNSEYSEKSFFEGMIFFSFYGVMMHLKK